MKNINVPGVFPGVIAMMLAVGFLRANNGYKKYKTKQYQASRILCAIGAIIFLLIAIFQVLETMGISFR